MFSDDRVLIDYRTADDAGVYKVESDRALVHTVDFFTPIVDDPFVYGQIAAANALSDVYAMGGRPLTALAIAACPKDVDAGTLKTIFAGGAQKLAEARVSLLGGHTVQNPEVIFGYAAMGEVHPARIWSNAGARAGDLLLLTKPLGTGVIATALKFGRAPAAAVDAAIASMSTLNRSASAALQALAPDAVHACTDVTGFGLIGHGSQMAAASRCTLEIDSSAVPLLDGARELAHGNIPGGGRTNAEHFARSIHVAADVPAELMLLLHDPQTSGGLLVAVAPQHADAAEAALAAAGVNPFRIGRVAAPNDARIVVR